MSHSPSIAVTQDDLAPSLDDSTFSLVKRLVKEHIRPHLTRFIYAVFCMLVVAGCTAALAYMIKHVIDDIFFWQTKHLLVPVTFIVFSVGCAKGLGTYGQAVTMKYIGQRIITDMQLKLYEHLLYADLALFSRESSGKLVSRFTNDITLMRRSVSNVLTGIFKEFLTLFALVGLMIYQSPILAFIALCAFPLAIYPILHLGKRMRRVSKGTQEELGQFTERLDETFQGVRVIKAYRQEAFETERARTVLEKLFRWYHKAIITESISSPIMETLGTVAIAMVIWYGGYQVITGATTPGTFFSFITAFIMAYKPVKSISGLNISLQEGLAAAKRLFSVLDIQPSIVDSKDARPLKLQGGEIVFDNVNFSYTAKRTALNQLSLAFPAGKTSALVGPSGGGKSTILNMVLRFYDPDSGTINIDGQALRDVTIHSLRDTMAFVGQETILFDDTVYANIAYSKPDASLDEVKQAAIDAAADDFIQDLPDGYNTIIGQNGLTLSGGQRQRIAIARAILKNAPILLLDEATSALDSISEKKIQKALSQLMQDRTTIVIAHRLSTVVNADMIYVIKRGQIVESGKHSELLKRKGEYSKLYKGLE